MNRSLLLAAVLMATATAPATPATAVGNGPVGHSCSFIGTPGLWGGGGYLSGGPMLESGGLRCTIQIGYDAHWGPDFIGDHAENSIVVTLNPRHYGFDRPSEPMYLCTEWEGGSFGVRYWDAATLQWSYDGSVPCQPITPVTTHEATPLVNAVLGIAHPIVTDADTNLDPTTCSLLPDLFKGTIADNVTVTEDGEVYALGTRVQECPPYENGPPPPPTVGDIVLIDVAPATPTA